MAAEEQSGDGFPFSPQTGMRLDVESSVFTLERSLWEDDSKQETSLTFFFQWSVWVSTDANGTMKVTLLARQMDYMDDTGFQ